jgi:hypothetical protein
LNPDLFSVRSTRVHVAKSGFSREKLNRFNRFPRFFVEFEVVSSCSRSVELLLWVVTLGDRVGRYSHSKLAGRATPQKSKWIPFSQFEVR